MRDIRNAIKQTIATDGMPTYHVCEKLGIQRGLNHRPTIERIHWLIKDLTDETRVLADCKAAKLWNLQRGTKL